MYEFSTIRPKNKAFQNMVDGVGEISWLT